MFEVQEIDSRMLTDQLPYIYGKKQPPEFQLIYEFIILRIFRYFLFWDKFRLWCCETTMK